MSDSLKESFRFLRSLLQKGDYFEFSSRLSEFEDIDYQDSDGNTLLHLAIFLTNYPAFIAIVSNGADINKQNNFHLTPLHIAIWTGSLQIAAPLLQAGANPNIIDSKGRVPLFFAVRRMDIQSIRLLLDYKADPNILFRNMSLLAYAAKTGNFQAIKLLLDAHADPHIGEPTPLETVIHYSSRECLAALLDGHEEDLLVPIKGRLLIEIALEAQTTLLSVVAVYTKRQFDEAKKKGETENLPVFPPKTLKRSHLKKLNAALKQNDYLLPVDIVRKSVLHIKSPWRPREKDDENEEAELVESMNLSLNSTMRSTRRAHLLETNGEDFGVPPTPFRYNDSQFPDSDDEDEETQSRSQSRSTTAASNVKRAFLTPNDSDDMSNDFHFHLMTPTSTPRTTRNKSPFA